MPTRPIHPNAFIGPELSDTDLRLIAETAGYCDAAKSFDGMTIPFAKRAVSDVRHLVAQVRRLQCDNERLIEETHRWSAADKQTTARAQAAEAETTKLRAQLTDQAEAERQLLLRDEENRKLRSRWISAVAQAQRFALRLGLSKEAEKIGAALPEAAAQGKEGNNG